MATIASFSAIQGTRSLAGIDISAAQAARTSPTSVNNLFEDRLTLQSQVAAANSSSSSISPSLRAKQSTLRELSTATSFVDIAQGAVNSIERDVDTLTELTTQIDNEVDPTKREALAAEAASIVSNINTTVSEASFLDGQSVIDAGAQTFTFTLDPEDIASQSSGSSTSVTVQNIPSPDDLGINLNQSDFLNNTSSTLATLKTAQAEIDATQTNLEASAAQVTTTANQIGIETELANTAADNQEPEQLAQTISSSIKSAIGGIEPSSVSADQVSRLLEPAASTPTPSTSSSDEE